MRRAVRVHIDELVLDGFDGEPDGLAAAVEQALAQRLSKDGADAEMSARRGTPPVADAVAAVIERNLP